MSATLPNLALLRTTGVGSAATVDDEERLLSVAEAAVVRAESAETRR